MDTWIIYTCIREQNALPAAEYRINTEKGLSEPEAIQVLYNYIKEFYLQPESYLSKYSIPDYTVAMRLL